MAFLAVATNVLAVVALALGMRVRQARREQYIRTYSFPPGLFDRLTKARPALEFKDIALVSRTLRHFFLAHLRSGRGSSSRCPRK